MRGHLLVGLTAYRDAHVPVPAEFSKPVCTMCLSRDSWADYLGSCRPAPAPLNGLKLIVITDTESETGEDDKN